VAHERLSGTAGNWAQYTDEGCWLPAEEGSRESVDAGCRNLTAPWVRDKAQSDPSVELCGYFEDLENAGPEVISGFGWAPPATHPLSSGLELAASAAP
jgi:hypothetical protein